MVSTISADIHTRRQLKTIDWNESGFTVNVFNVTDIFDKL